MSVAIAWFRRDLRLTVNPALEEARAAADIVIPVYIHAPEEDGAWRPGAASRWWLHRSLSALSADLGKRGSALVFRRGPSLEALLRLTAETGATSVHWNRLYKPAAIARDTAVNSAHADQGIHPTSSNGSLLSEALFLGIPLGIPNPCSPEPARHTSLTILFGDSVNGSIEPCPSCEGGSLLGGFGQKGIMGAECS